MYQRTLSVCALAALLAAPLQAAISGPSHTIANPTGRRLSQFGYSTLTLDFDGDGVEDIAAGAPGESTVHVFYGPDYATSRSYSSPGNWQRDLFGHDLAAGKLNAAPGDELVVGAPDRAQSRDHAGGAVYVLTHRSLQVHRVPFFPQDGAQLGNSVAVGDIDGDHRAEVIVGAPKQMISGVAAGAVHCFSLLPRAGWTVGRHRLIANPQGATIHGNYGHDLAVGDANGDGMGDLFVSAIGNDSTDGFRFAGQVYVHRGPIPGGGVDIVEDPTRLPTDPPRFGMSISVADVNGDGRVELLVGSPRKDTSSLTDTGLGYLFYGPNFHASSSRTFARPTVRRHDILGYRALAADLIGGPEPDVVFGSLAREQDAALFVWDGGNLDAPPVKLVRPLGGSVHYMRGLSIGPRSASGKQDLIVGDPEFSLPGKRKTGRIQFGFN